MYAKVALYARLCLSTVREAQGADHFFRMSRGNMASREWVNAIKSSDEAAIQRLREAHKDFSLEGESFSNVQLGTLPLKELNFANTEWENCIFDGVQFLSSDLSGAFFNACTFHNCVFNASTLDDVSFDGCVMQRTIFKDISPSALELANCQFKECEWTDITLDEAQFSSLSFTAGKLQNISGNGSLQAVVLRNVAVDEFDTEQFEMNHCTASGTENLPKGFTRCEGNRKRV